MSVNSKMTAVADEIRVLSGTTDAMGLDSMAAHVGNANQTIGEQKTLISTIKSALAGKTAGSVDLPELTGEGTAADLMKGKQLIGSAGNVVRGSFTLENEMTEQNDLIPRIKAALAGKAAGGGCVVEPDYKDLYQRVEYITSAEEETYPYFITDFYADNACGVEVVASFPTLVDRIPMGSRENSDPTRFYCVYPLSANSIYYGFNTGSSVSCQLKVNTIYRLQTNFLNSRLVNVYDEDGIRKGGASLSATLTQQTAPVSIFGYNSASSGAVSSKREFKLYSARCSSGHEVVREYIPCYRKSDGVVGLYEKCTGQFLTGEGAFTKGADIDW